MSLSAAQRCSSNAYEQRAPRRRARGGSAALGTRWAAARRPVRTPPRRSTTASWSALSVCAYLHIHMCICICINTHKHTHTNTHTHISLSLSLSLSFSLSLSLSHSLGFGVDISAYVKLRVFNTCLCDTNLRMFHMRLC